MLEHRRLVVSWVAALHGFCRHGASSESIGQTRWRLVSSGLRCFLGRCCDGKDLGELGMASVGGT
jgi:hypothetical protein